MNPTSGGCAYGGPDQSSHGTIVVVVDGVMTLRGEIDVVLTQSWTTRYPQPTDVRVVDAAAVTHFGSAGLQLLIDLARQLNPTRLLLRQPTRPVLRTLQVTGLADPVDIQNAR